MESRMSEISARHNRHIKIGYIPGHFATNHSHVNNYMDMTMMKTQHKMAKETAKELSTKLMSVQIDTIICLEGTEMIGAFLASELSGGGMNIGSDINVLTPELNSNNQMVFRDNTQKAVWGKNIMLLISSVSTGKTINRMVECLQYYNGNLTAISSIFSARKESHGFDINCIFSADDVPNYDTYLAGDCPLCKAGQKVDAIINSFGYSKI